MNALLTLDFRYLRPMVSNQLFDSREQRSPCLHGSSSNPKSIRDCLAKTSIYLSLKTGLQLALDNAGPYAGVEVHFVDYG